MYDTNDNTINQAISWILLGVIHMVLSQINIIFVYIYNLIYRYMCIHIQYIYIYNIYTHNDDIMCINIYIYAYNTYVNIPTALMMTSSSARWLGSPGAAQPVGSAAHWEALAPTSGVPWEPWEPWEPWVLGQR